MLRPIITLLFTLSIFLTHSGNASEVVTVAKDGSGDFKSIQAAIDGCKAFRDYKQQIYIKNGVYREKIKVYAYLKNIELVGESKEETIITFSDFAGLPGIGTFNSYTLQVLGDFTSISHLTIKNEAGPVGQAVALHIDADGVEVTDCSIEGNQDTVYAAGDFHRQRFKDCYIEGTTDFVFGSAIVLFENCVLHSKADSYITAANTPKLSKYGYVFKNCKLTADEGVNAVYLGRPWRDFAKVVFLNCEMGAHIRPEGWHNWGQPNREKTVVYAEYESKGEGAEPGQRVAWSQQLTKKEVDQYTQDQIFSYSISASE